MDGFLLPSLFSTWCRCTCEGEIQYRLSPDFQAKHGLGSFFSYNMYFGFKYDIHRSTTCTHPKSDLTGDQTHDLQIMDSTSHAPEIIVLTTEPSGTSCIWQTFLASYLLISTVLWSRTSFTLSRSWPSMASNKAATTRIDVMKRSYANVSIHQITLPNFSRGISEQTQNILSPLMMHCAASSILVNINNHICDLQERNMRKERTHVSKK